MLGLVPVFVSTILAQTTIPAGTSAPATTPTTIAPAAAPTTSTTPTTAPTTIAPAAASTTTPTKSADVATPPTTTLPEEEPRHQLHFGIEARADLWRHPLRPAIGVQSGRFDLSLITDPGMFLDGKSDVDLLFGYWLAPHAWQMMVGWRNSSVQIASGRRYDETLLFGLNAAMPLIDGKHVHATFGVELAADLVRHGGDVPIHTLPTSLADIADYLSFGFNARFEYSLGF